MTDVQQQPAIDPHAFVAEAERLTNAHDAAGAAAVYAEDARLELVTNGAVEWHEGRAAIADAWAVVLGAGAKAGFTVRKEVVAATPTVVVNRWTGSFGGRGTCRGIESWTFGPDGLVVEHRAETFTATHPGTTLAGRLAVLLAAPRIALRLASAQRAVAKGRR